MQQSGYPTVTTCSMTIRCMLRASRTGVNPVRHCSGLRELNPTWELNPGPQGGSHHYCWTTKPTNEKFVRKRVICGSWVVLHVEGYSMCGGLLDRGVNWRGTVRWKVKLRGATASCCCWCRLVTRNLENILNNVNTKFLNNCFVSIMCLLSTIGIIW